MAGGSRRDQGQPGRHREFHNIQGYTERLCLKISKLLINITKISFNLLKKTSRGQEAMKLGGGHVRGTQEKLEKKMGSGYDCIALYTCMKFSKK